MRRLLPFLLLLTGCHAHELFGPRKPPPPKEKCYFRVGFEVAPGDTTWYVTEVPCTTP